MSDFGIKLAYSGIGIGLLLLSGLPLVPALGPIGGAVYFGAFVFCYVGLPMIGISYDLKSGDFEDREGYQP
jgi:hypothetical protein